MAGSRWVGVRALGILTLVISGSWMASSCTTADRNQMRTGSPVAARAASGLRRGTAALQQDWYIFRAEQLLVERCMRSHGFQYFVSSAGPMPGPNVMTIDSSGNGASPTYDIVRDERARRRSVETAYVASLGADDQAAYASALGGSTSTQGSITLPSGTVISYQTGGCVGSARAALFEDVDAAIRSSMVPQDVDRSFEASMFEGSRFESALSEWRRCMYDEGWKVADPSAILDSIDTAISRGMALRVAGAKETAIANADFKCDQRSRLRATMHALVIGFLADEPPLVVSELMAAERSKAEAAVRAMSLLGLTDRG